MNINHKKRGIKMKVEMILLGVILVALIGYLLYALAYPEKF